MEEIHLCCSQCEITFAFNILIPGDPPHLPRQKKAYTAQLVGQDAASRAELSASTQPNQEAWKQAERHTAHP